MCVSELEHAVQNFAAIFSVFFFGRFGVQTPARAEIWFEISVPPVPPSQLSFDEYTDRTLPAGRWDGETEDWPPTRICRGQENEVTSTSYPWLLQGYLKWLSIFFFSVGQKSTIIGDKLMTIAGHLVMVVLIKSYQKN